MVPFPEALESVFSLEWENINYPKHHKILDKLYICPDLVMKKLRVPTVDALKRSFESASQTFRASVTSSIIFRATYV